MENSKSTIFDDPLAWLEETHLDLIESDHADDRSEITPTQKAVKTIGTLHGNSNATLKITVDVVENDRTLSSVTFHVDPRRMVQWRKILSGEVAVIKDKEKVVNSKARKLRLSSIGRLLGLALNRAVVSGAS